VVKACVRFSENGDGTLLAPNLRLADRREVIAHSGSSAREALELNLQASDKAWTVILEEEPIAIFGYIRSGEDEANIWMLGSDKIKDIKWQFLRESKRWLIAVMEDFSRVWAIADVRNIAHKDWYEWLGFSVVTTILTGPFNLPFYHIEYIREKV
jgi:hypothetical protein